MKNNHIYLRITITSYVKIHIDTLIYEAKVKHICNFIAILKQCIISQTDSVCRFFPKYTITKFKKSDDCNMQISF